MYNCYIVTLKWDIKSFMKIRTLLILLTVVAPALTVPDAEQVLYITNIYIVSDSILSLLEIITAHLILCNLMRNVL